jgi:DNA-directed RNA polymerase subunit RPC12/RpoP
MTNRTADQFCATSIKERTGEPVASKTHAPQSGREIARKGIMQIRQNREQASAANMRAVVVADAAGPGNDPLSAALERAHHDYARSRRSKVLEFTRTSPSLYAACPSCGYDMTVTSAIPTFLREGCEDIAYTCKKCGTQIQRTVKSS